MMKNLKTTRLNGILSKLFIAIAFLFFSTSLIGQTWNQQGADIEGEAAGDFSGHSVSLSADGLIAAIGAPSNAGNGTRAGHVRVYKLISGTWVQQGADIEGEAAGDFSGQSVSLSADGSIVAIGANINAGNGARAGHVRVYKLISGVWTQQGTDIDGEAAGDFSGWSVSLSADGSIVAIGATFNAGNGLAAGHVRVFKLISGVWIQQGADIDGEAADGRSGFSVSLSADGSIVAIGAPNNNGNGVFAGHVRVFKLISGVWTQQGADIDGEAAGDRSGESVSLSADGSTVAIGAPMNAGNGSEAGHVRVYKLISGAWTQQGGDIDGEAAGDRSGESVSLSADGSTVAIGASSNAGNGKDAGHVRVYKLISGVWIQQGADIEGEAAGDFSGQSVSLSADGSIVAIGAASNDGNGANAGHVRVFGDKPVGGLNLDKSGNNIKLYPNPTSRHVEIVFEKTYSDISIQVNSITGRLVYSSNFDIADRVRFDIPGAKGLYLITVTTSEGRTKRIKVTKN
jgi:type IX secretion system substrate protein